MEVTFLLIVDEITVSSKHLLRNELFSVLFHIDPNGLVAPYTVDPSAS